MAGNDKHASSIEELTSRVSELGRLAVTGVAMVAAVAAGLNILLKYAGTVGWTEVSIAILVAAVSALAYTNLSRRVFSVSFGGIEVELGDQSPPKQTGLDYYEYLAKASRAVARSLYDRSGVYLIIGVCMALAGLIVFYFVRVQTAKADAYTAMSIGAQFLAFLPASSMLILLELVAFFFLRQSRAVMDEFRHFDTLARYREEVLAVLRMSQEQAKPVDMIDFVNRGLFFSRAERLAAGESTEIIEGRKLEKTEADILAKIVELISARTGK